MPSLTSPVGFPDPEIADEVEPMEDTPLLRVVQRDIPTIISIFGLLLILVVGSVIGIYLLQDDKEHIEPPELTHSRHVDWDSNEFYLLKDHMKPSTIYLTEITMECIRLSCSPMAEDMQKSLVQESLAYKFLVTNEGMVVQTYDSEAPSLSCPCGISLALIGNFTNEAPPPTQVRATAEFIAYNEGLGHFNNDYKIIVYNRSAHLPLYKSFKNLTHFCASCDGY